MVFTGEYHNTIVNTAGSLETHGSTNATRPTPREWDAGQWCVSNELSDSLGIQGLGEGVTIVTTVTIGEW